MTGWIKLHRKALDDGWLSEHKLWAFWTYCLLKVAHKDTTIFFNGRQVTLLKGQLIIGRKKAAQELKLGEQEIRTCIKKLKKYGNITIKPTTHYSIITIVNWDTYQSSEDEANQQSNQDLTNGQPAPNHKQEVKNERNKYLPIFESFWEAYPKRNGVKVGKRAAFKLFLSLQSEDYEPLLQATGNYANSKTAKDGYAKDPERFLKNDYWRDWIEVKTKNESEFI